MEKVASRILKTRLNVAQNDWLNQIISSRYTSFSDTVCLPVIVTANLVNVNVTFHSNLLLQLWIFK